MTQYAVRARTHEERSRSTPGRPVTVLEKFHLVKAPVTAGSIGLCGRDVQIDSYAATWAVVPSHQRCEECVRWVTVTPGEQWVLQDDNGDMILRHVAKLGPYLGVPATFRVTGPDYEATDHSTETEATTAAEASLGEG
jgi:hypothetical protein